MKDNKLVVTVNDSEFAVDVMESGLSINGTHYDINLLKKISNDVQALSVNNQVLTIGFERHNGDSKIRLNNFDYNVQVKTEQFATFEKYMQVKSGAGNRGGKVKAPMPGLVVKINVAAGDEVKKGDKLISLEAMKMENAISSPSSGVVKSVMVKEGQTVEKDSVLIELE